MNSTVFWLRYFYHADSTPVPFYQYTARNKENRVIEGAIEAASQETAAAMLSEKGLFVTKIAAKKGGGSPLLSIKKMFQGVSKKDLSILLRQLSILVAASVPIVQSLKMIVGQTQNKTLRDALLEVSADIEGGTKLSSAIERFPGIFSAFFVNMVKSGETSGKLDEVLGYLADQQERDYELEGKIKGAMVYPIFIVSVMGVAGFVMMTFVMPKMLAMFTEAGGTAQLPFATKVLIAVSGFFQGYWWVIIIAFIGLVVGIRAALARPEGRILWDKTKLAIPVFGRLFQYIYVVRFTRSLNTTLIGGVTITAGLLVIKDVMGNAVFQDIIVKAIRDVEEGMQLSASLVNSKEMPSMVSQMISVGEQTGRLDDVLERLTNFYTREIDGAIASVITLIEPMIMILLGVAVGIMVAGILLPMYSLANAT